MPEIPGIGQKDAVRVLEKRGFRVVRQGKHLTLSNGAIMVQVPRHTTINAFTMGYIARVAGLSPEQFRELLGPTGASPQPPRDAQAPSMLPLEVHFHADRSCSVTGVGLLARASLPRNHPQQLRLIDHRHLERPRLLAFHTRLRPCDDVVRPRTHAAAHFPARRLDLLRRLRA